MLVYRSPDGSVCECCHPSVTWGADGTLYVLWRNSLAGARDMYVASSADEGKSFGKAAKLGGGTWPLKACPMDGGAIAVGAGGKVATVWRRESTVYLTDGDQNAERSLGPGEQPVVTATAAGPYVAWLKKRGELAYLLAPGSSSPTVLARHAADPVIAVAADGRGPVVAAWESRDGQNYSIQCQVVGNARSN